MVEQQLDVMTMVKYAVGALLILAGVALVYIGKIPEGMGVIALGLGLLGYQLGERAGIKKGYKMAKP